MGKYDGRTFELLPDGIALPNWSLNNQPITVGWNYFTDFEDCKDADFRKHLVNRYLRRGKSFVEKAKDNIKQFIMPILTLEDVIIFISLVACADPGVLDKNTVMNQARELLKLIDSCMIIYDAENNTHMSAKDFIRDTVDELTTKYEAEFRDIVNMGL